MTSGLDFLFAPTSLSGKRIGRYVVGGRMSQSASSVYSGWDTNEKKKVVLKSVPPFAQGGDNDWTRRLRREALLLRRVEHPNIARLADFVSPNGIPVLVLERVQGKTLHEILGGRPLPVNDALHHARQIAEAMAATHAAGIVHRDLKPANIMVGPNRHLTVLDFGIAKDLTQGLDVRYESVTQPGAVLGTPGYMAPEQATGSAADFRSDIFSFGAVLHEMLSGQRVFAANEKQAATLVSNPKPLSASVPPELASIVWRCLEQSPERRFQTAEELLAALERAQPAIDTVPLLMAGATVAVILVLRALTNRKASGKD